MHPHRRRLLAAALVALTSAGLAACIPRVERPQVHVRGVHFLGADLHALHLRVDLAIYNPNPFELPIRELSAALTVAGRQTGTATIRERHVLPPQRELPVAAQVELPWGSLPEALARAVREPELPFGLTGEVTVEVGGFTARTRYAHQGLVPRALLVQSAASSLPGLLQHFRHAPASGGAAP